MRFDRHPIDLIVFHDPFRKGQRVKCFSYLTLLSRRMGDGHDRLFAAQLFAPRIPPGRTLGRYPRLCGLLMTTGYVVFKVRKITPSLLGHGKGSTSTVFPKVFSKNFSRAKRSAKRSLREDHVVWHIPRERLADRKGKARRATLVASISICERPPRIYPRQSCQLQFVPYPNLGR